ncbi:MAG: hypothetical protein DRP50_00515 [Thermotoga sp.]|nr:DUF1669 domain-containing protein [Thermotogota bacterium]RKX56348.1 MAG: hypothetical protein DRP50_00515 [Thermotoga sp.]
MIKKIVVYFLIVCLCAIVSFSNVISLDRMEIVFNDPPYDSGMKKALTNFVDSAASSIALAAYSLRGSVLRDALLKAAKRGVKIRVVADDSNIWNFYILKSKGIKVRFDASPSLMHNKFIIVDDRKVWTGSTNFTHMGLNFHNNNSIIIDATPVARDFERDFEQMWNGDFHENKRADRYHEFSVDGTPVETFFSPEDGIEEEIIKSISRARKGVYIEMYSFTDYRIANALRILLSRGIDVKILLDEDWNTQNKYSIYYKLDEHDPLFKHIRLDGNKIGLLHDKVMIIDPEGSKPTVITGSYNYTKSANYRNDENAVFIYSSGVAKVYYKEFLKLWSEGKTKR